MAEEHVLAPGASFRVVWRFSRDECRDFEGVYRGMSAIGTETALVFEVDGVTRFISASAVVYLDQTSEAPEASGRKSDAGSVFYG